MKKEIKRYGIVYFISFFLCAILIVTTYIFANDKINEYANLINTVTIDTNIKESVKENVIGFNYPEYGTVYGKLIIDKIDVNLPIYHGDTLDILSHGIGHYSGSYFPSEGGSIIYAGHNTTRFLKRIDELEIGDKITVETTYGTFIYQVNNMKVVSENDLEAFPINKEEEMLIIYTCYPIRESVIGRRTKRYVVYAPLVRDTNE